METKFKRNKSCLKPFFWGVIVLVLLQYSLLHAGNHPKSKFEWNESKKIGFFDLVVSLDWNPVQNERDTTLAPAFNHFAKIVYEMTEGTHKIRKIYVYVKTAEGEQEKGSCDIYLKKTSGGAEAYTNYFNHQNGRINMFTSTSSGTVRDAIFFGESLAHEFGHYVYGLYDEYVGRLASSTSDSKPLSTDTRCKASIMNGHTNNRYYSNEFCTDINHMGGDKKPSGATNAQHRMHQGSCWRTLVRNPNDDPWTKKYTSRMRRTQYTHLKYPENGATNVQSGGNEELEIIYIEEASNQVVLIIDCSGSMSGAKIEQAKASAKQFVDLLQIGDKVAVVAFSSTVSVPLALTEITGPPPQTNIKTAIASITASGSTAMGDGMRKALNILLNSADPKSRRTAVLLGNGWHNYGSEHPDQVTPDYKSNSIPIFTIGLGSGADQTLMSKIANATNGKFYFSPSAAELQEIYAAIAQASTSSGQLVDSSSDILTQKEMVEKEIIADSSMANFTCLTSWNQGDVIKLEMVTPAGQVISPANVDNFSDVSYSSESTYALYRIQSPTNGKWKVRATAETVTGTGEINRQIQTVTDMNLSVEVSDTSINYPSPIGIIAALRKDLYIVDATVSATIMAPDGSKSVLTLRDDGESPDFRPEDGFYSGVFTDYSMDGVYEIIVTSTNPNLSAAESNVGALEMGGIVIWNLIGEDFLRSAKTTVTINGVMQDDHGDTMEAATRINTDRTPVQGKIEQSGDLDYFTFDASANETYSIRTSQLVDPMDTFIILYNQNGAIISSNDNGGGETSSLIVWTAPITGTYYVSVEGVGSQGNYQLSVGIKQTWEGSAPTVRITAPLDDATVSGNVTLVVEAQDDEDIRTIDFYINKVLKLTCRDEPYTYDWDTTSYPYGRHIIKVKACDITGLVSKDRITVFVDNPPSLTITSPQNNTIVNGTVVIQADVHDDDSVSKVEFYIDGELKHVTITAPYDYDWNSTLYANGTHSIEVKAYDSAGKVTVGSVTVNVDNTP